MIEDQIAFFHDAIDRKRLGAFLLNKGDGGSSLCTGSTSQLRGERAEEVSFFAHNGNDDKISDLLFASRCRVQQWEILEFLNIEIETKLIKENGSVESISFTAGAS